MTLEEALAFDLPKLVKTFLTIRNRLKAETDAFDEKMKPAKDLRDIVNAALHKKLLDLGANSVKTDEGTPYLSTTMSAKVSDWETFHAFVEETQEPDFLKRDCVPSKVQEWVDKNGQPPPGIEISYITKCNVKS